MHRKNVITALVIASVAVGVYVLILLSKIN